MGENNNISDTWCKQEQLAEGLKSDKGFERPTLQQSNGEDSQQGATLISVKNRLQPCSKTPNPTLPSPAFWSKQEPLSQLLECKKNYFPNYPLMLSVSMPVWQNCWHDSCPRSSWWSLPPTMTLQPVLHHTYQYITAIFSPRRPFLTSTSMWKLMSSYYWTK